MKMRLCLLNTNPSYSHKIQYDGIKEALLQMASEDPEFELMKKNIAQQDDGEILKWKPDYIFVSAPLAAGFRVWEKYRNIKCIIYDTEGLYEPALTRDSMRYATFAATVDKRGCEYFNSWAKNNGVKCKVYHMPLGFSPSLFRYQEVSDEYKSDVCMAGVIFNRRRKVIEDLHYINNKFIFRVITAKDWVGRIIHPNSIQHLHRDVVSPEEMNKYYSGSKIILCVNRDYDPSNDTGIPSTTPGRVFQETATRRMVMIDNSRPELFDYFEDGKEIVSFDSNKPDELKDKVLYYLNHDEEREAIAHNGYVKTMNTNTWKHRLNGFFNFIKDNGGLK